jgi:glycosidase
MFISHRSLSALFTALLLAACVAATAAPVETPTLAPPPTLTPAATAPAPAGPWWRDAVFYEIFVRSFKDSDGDGIGDFNGIIEKLDYLEQLGVRGLWLMPIHPSPTYHGYDVTDYYAVNPDYGTMDDFKRLLAEARRRNIRIIIDLVLNHTSARHPWFQKALQGDPVYREWYIWSDKDPGYLGPWNAQAWHRAGNGQYYYAIFWDQMPDLNYDNPAVREEVKKITAFWLRDVGVDGFRLDAIRYLDEEGRILADAETTHAFLKEWGAYYRSLNPEAFTVGEVWTDNYNVAPYVRGGDELDSAFNFDMSNALLKGLSEGNATLINFVLGATLQLFPQQNNANFLTNHDINRIASYVGPDPLGQSRAAATVLLTAPGIPFIYYGEEIGMTGVKPDERLRTPMQWTGEPGAGFTTGTPWQKINADSVERNVAAQTGDPDSLLEHYRSLIALRNAHPALSNGATVMVKANSRRLVSYLRTSGEEVMLIVVNVDNDPVSDYALSLERGPLAGNYTAKALWGFAAEAATLTANADGGFDAYTPTPEIPAYGGLILLFSR